MKHCDICGELGDYPPKCPGCGAVANHPPSLDHLIQTDWWCRRCLEAKIMEARL